MLTIPYDESFGVQANWPDTIDPKPRKINGKFFIDVGNDTVAVAESIEEAVSLQKHYPQGVIRYWEPTQEEYEEELKEAKQLRLHNFGIMSCA